MATGAGKNRGETEQVGFDRKRELKAFDDTKSGVKGLVDSGIKEVPQIFIASDHEIDENPDHVSEQNHRIPVIDLQWIQRGERSRSQVVDRIRDACENWGFFQVINHGIPDSAMDGIAEGIRRFHEQEGEVKREFYCRGFGKKVMFNSNYSLFTLPVADWRDTFYCFMAPNPPHPEELPTICRDAIIEYSNQVMKVGHTLFELISMALGLEPGHLKDIGCAEGLVLVGHYYPQCPQPHLTLGASKHTDTDFLTILLQDQVSGLQVLHQDTWVNVPPMCGALVVNLGDLMQLITNGKFKSVNHRVLARSAGPRVSVACFIRPQNDTRCASRLYGPIKEILSKGEAPIYKEITLPEFDTHHHTKRIFGVSTIEHFKI